MSVGEDEEDEVGIRDEDGVRDGVDEEVDDKWQVYSKNVTSTETTYLHSSRKYT